MMSDELGNGSKRNGQHFTKRSLIKLIIDELEIKETDLCYDPSCGTGGFILEFAKRYPTTEFINNNIYGQELLEDVHKILCFNMLAHHVDGCLEHLSNGDTMDRTYNNFSKDKFDKIGANPPFGVSIDSYPDYYKIKVKDSVALFIQHIYYSLKNGGKAGIVIDRGILNNGTDKNNSWEGSLRKFLCDNCQITKIINLPTGIFKHTNFATSVIFFTKGGKTTEIKYNEGYFKLEDKGKSDKTMYLDSENEKILTIEEIKKKNYSLKYDDYFKVKQEKRAGWVNLGDVCEINIGGTPSRRESSYWNGNNLWVSVAELKNNIIIDTKEKITEKGIENSNVKLVPKGYILMSFKLSIGKIALSGKPLYCNEAIAFFCGNENFLTNYLWYYLHFAKFDHLTNGQIGNGSLNKNTLKEIQIPNLSLEHQTKIVDFLDEVYQENSLEETVKYMKDYPIFNLLINKDYDGFREILWYQKNIQFVMGEIVNVKRKKNNHIRSLFNTVKGQCKMMKLGEIVEVKSGKRLPKDHNFTKNITNHPYIKVGDIDNILLYDNYLDKMSYISEETYNLIKNYIIHSGDLIMSSVGSVGKMLIVPEYLNGANLTENCVKLTIKNKIIDKYYLYLYLKSIYDDIIKIGAQGNCQPKLGIFQINAFVIPIPPLSIQQSIINKINQLNDQSSHYEQYAKTLQTELELMNETISNLTLYSEEIKSDDPIESIRNNDIYDDTDKLIKSLNTKNLKIKQVECEMMDV